MASADTEMELFDLEDVCAICNNCGKEDLDVDDCKFCHKCMQVAFCSVECAKQSWDEHSVTCVAIAPEQFKGLIEAPPGRRRGGGGGGGGGRDGRGSFRPGGGGGGGRPSRFRPGGTRPRFRPAGGFRPYRAPRGLPGRYDRSRRWFGRGRTPWALGFYNPFWYSMYDIWYPRYWTPNFTYAGVLPTLPVLPSLVDQAIIQAQLLALRADPRYAIPGAMIVPDPATGSFIYVGI